MIDPNLIIAIIMAICALVSAVVAIYALSASKHKDGEDNAARSAVMQSDLGYIKGGIDELKKRLDKQDSLIMQILQRLTCVEESVASAHKRINGLEEKS